MSLFVFSYSKRKRTIIGHLNGKEIQDCVSKTAAGCPCNYFGGMYSKISHYFLLNATANICLTIGVRHRKQGLKTPTCKSYPFFVICFNTSEFFYHLKIKRNEKNFQAGWGIGDFYHNILFAFIIYTAKYCKFNCKIVQT